MQNGLNGKPRKRVALFRLEIIIEQIGLHLSNRTQFNKLSEHQPDKLCLFGIFLQHSRLMYLAINRHTAYGLGTPVTRWRIAAQPPSRLGKLMHIVGYSLCNNVTLQLCKNRAYHHHSPAHRRGIINVVADRTKTNAVFFQLLIGVHKVRCVAAYPVKTVANNQLKLTIAAALHHLLKFRALGVATRKALILELHNVLINYIIFAFQRPPAYLNLVFNTLTFAGEFGFAAVNCVFSVIRHIILPFVIFTIVVYHYGYYIIIISRCQVPNIKTSLNVRRGLYGQSFFYDAIFTITISSSSFFFSFETGSASMCAVIILAWHWATVV